jgi:hypothetical protein
LNFDELDISAANQASSEDSSQEPDGGSPNEDKSPIKTRTDKFNQNQKSEKQESQENGQTLNVEDPSATTSAIHQSEHSNEGRGKLT